MQETINDGDVLYIPNNTNYAVKEKFEAVIVNTPVFGVKKNQRKEYGKTIT